MKNSESVTLNTTSVLNFVSFCLVVSRKKYHWQELAVWVATGAHPARALVTGAHDSAFCCCCCCWSLQKADSSAHVTLRLCVRKARVSILNFRVYYIRCPGSYAMLALLHAHPVLLPRHVGEGHSGTHKITCMQPETRGILLTFKFYSGARLAVLTAFNLDISIKKENKEMRTPETPRFFFFFWFMFSSHKQNDPFSNLPSLAVSDVAASNEILV